MEIYTAVKDLLEDREWQIVFAAALLALSRDATFHELEDHVSKSRNDAERDLKEIALKLCAVCHLNQVDGGTPEVPSGDDKSARSTARLVTSTKYLVQEMAKDGRPRGDGISNALNCVAEELRLFKAYD